MTLKRIFFFGFCLPCWLLGQLSPASAETLRYGSASRDAAYRSRSPINVAPAASPYQLRRVTARAEAREEYAAPAAAPTPNAQPYTQAAAESSAPLKVVIPNPETAYQERAPSSVFAASGGVPYVELPRQEAAAAASAPAAADATAFDDLLSELAELLPSIPGVTDTAMTTPARPRAERKQFAGLPQQKPAEQAAVPQTPVTAVYRSPGIIIKKETATLIPPASAAPDAPMQMAALAPAAGEPQAEAVAPLIPLPAAPPPAEPEKPLEALVEASPPPPASAPASPPQDIPPPVAPALDSPPPAEVPASTEPVPALSQESKAIVKKIPANLDSPANAQGGPMQVDRAKDLQNVFGTQAQGSVRQDGPDIKIETKRPKLDLDYELEKAYSALVAGHGSTAIAIYKRVLENDADNKNALFGLATAYHRSGQLDAARPLYGKLLAMEPGHRDALNNFLVLLADEAPEEALAQMERLEAKNPDFSPIPAQMAVVYQRLGRTDLASEKMFRAIFLAPENLVYRYNLAVMLDKQGKREEAANLYRQLLEAHRRGEAAPGDIRQIQERLTFISSNRH